jgi:uncharacterized protein involved in response to NO
MIDAQLTAEAAQVAPDDAEEGARESFFDLIRNQPFRWFFALGIIFGWIGTSHWILYAAHLRDSYSGTLHANIQLECFEIAFAAGFLFTAIPRRTSSPPPSWIALGTVTLGLVFSAGANLFLRPDLGAWGYALSLATVAAFAVRRFLAFGGVAERRPPASFVLVPLALLSGISGAILSTGVFDIPLWLVDVAADLIR